MKIKTAIIGTGAIYPFHEEGLTKQGSYTLSAVCDQNISIREIFRKRGIPFYSDYAEMLIKEKPDLAVICLPHYLHKPAAEVCIRAGCHVLLEKPMAMNTAECDSLIELAEKKGVRIFVAHTQKYKPEIQAAKKIMEEGRLGSLIGIADRRYLSYYRPDRPKWFMDPEKSGGGILMNLGGHSLERLLFLTGEEFRCLKAFFSPAGKEIESAASLQMETVSGVPVFVVLNGYSDFYLEETELLFTGGSIKIEIQKKVSVSNSEGYQEILYSDSHPFHSLYNEIYEVLSSNKSSLQGLQARKIVSLIEKAYQSALSGERVLL
ncbi:Gfo/Idh/MocA family protein [Metabacillus sp. RGM 3146]|uniref:Gfo/Idh/MocA family protein n=1 Tax=Metabacillus sp. RGM 3146 TaxID=3401092 RepID=UPI003B9CEE51